MGNLTEFRRRIIEEMEKDPMGHASTCAFPGEWKTRSKRGGLIRNIVLAGRVLQDMGLIWVLPPKDQWDDRIYCLRKENWENFKKENDNGT